MTDRSKDDLTPSVQDEQDLPIMPPERDRTAEDVENREQIEEDQEEDDRFQATDN